MTITDGDGDTNSDSIELGSLIHFEDDGPKVTFPTLSLNDLTVDESVGVGAGDPNANDETTVDLPTVLDTYASANSLTLLGAAVSTATPNAVVDYGSDGPGSLVRTFSLVANVNGDPITDGMPTGLNMSVGPQYPVFLYQQGGLLVGRAGTDGIDAADGTIVFAIHIDPTTGTVSMAQYRAVIARRYGRSRRSPLRRPRLGCAC